MRIGECADLSFDRLRAIGPGQWAILTGNPETNPLESLGRLNDGVEAIDHEAPTNF